MGGGGGDGREVKDVGGGLALISWCRLPQRVSVRSSGLGRGREGPRPAKAEETAARLEDSRGRTFSDFELPSPPYSPAISSDIRVTETLYTSARISLEPNREQKAWGESEAPSPAQSLADFQP